jgi:hypothetical protein
MKKSQAALELIIILAAGLAILGAIIVVNNKIITGTSGKIESTKARTVVDTLADAAELVYQQGVGSRTRVFIALPSNIQSFTIYNQTLDMQLYAGGDLRNTYNIFDFNVSGILPTNEGNYWLYVEAKQGYVEISQNITVEADTTAPVISNVRNGTVTNQSALILWSTDENTNSTVYYGTTLSLGSEQTDAALTQSHSVNLISLTNNSLYYYKVGSCDSSSNCANSSIHNFTTAQNPAAPPTQTSVILFAQACAAEDEATKGSFGAGCDGSYPSSCGAGKDLLTCNDGNSEEHTFDKNNYGGVRIQSFNTSITNCDSIIGVKLCYEWWYAGSRSPQDCDVSVDSNNGASYTAVTTTCPGTTANPGVTCTNVTSLETWSCSNFFGASGTRVLTKSELTRTTSGPNAAQTATWDLLYFNVTYTTS